jgi:methylated-DNA-protein-cysteine methyltransferase-like protein
VQLVAGFRIVSPPSAFEQRVYDLLAQVPPGSVVSYGRLADWLECPGASRAVGRALGRCPVGLPAHRVVNASGRLAPGWEREQRERLRAEGVRVRGDRVVEPIPWWDRS